MTIYTGDPLLKVNNYGDVDLNFINGQPEMTNGLETYVLLAVFGEDSWQNATETDSAYKMQSEFPALIDRATITDKTLQDGIKALEKALSYMVTKKIAKSVTVTGSMLTAYCLYWLIEIEALTDESLKYYINWEKGVLTADIVKS